MKPKHHYLIKPCTVLVYTQGVQTPLHSSQQAFWINSETTARVASVSVHLYIICAHALWKMRSQPLAYMSSTTQEGVATFSTTHGAILRFVIFVHISDKSQQCTGVLRGSIHALRWSRVKRWMCKSPGANDTDQTKRIIMRILYYQCVNGVSFLSGY